MANDSTKTGTGGEPARRQGRRGRGTMRRRSDQPCLNCGDVTPGNYCPSCGQAKREVAVSVSALAMDVLEDQLIINKALPRTVGNLVFKPGLLTTEYVNGRIVRYIAPFRLYLVTSVLFFLLLSFVGLRALERMQIGDEAIEPPVADSVRADMNRQLDALARIDTASLPPEARLQVAATRAALAGVSQSLDSMRIEVPEMPTLPRGVLQPWAANLEIDTGNSGMDSVLIAHAVERYGHLPPGEALRAFVPDYAEYMPQTVFILLPIFAFLLKLLYIRRSRYYAEHFVFALHVHAFVFIMFIVMLLLRNEIVIGVLSLWILLYVWLAMKRVYAQGVVRTTAKYGALGCAYSTVLNLAMLATVFVVLLMG